MLAPLTVVIEQSFHLCRSSCLSPEWFRFYFHGSSVLMFTLGEGVGLQTAARCLQGSAELDFGSEQGAESSTEMLFKCPITSSA